MYYILNETDQIIAADDNLLRLCNVENISDLSSMNETTLTFQDEKSVTIKTNDSKQTFSVSKTSLSSTQGHMTLVELGEALESADTITDALVLDIMDDAKDEKLAPLDLDEEVSFDITKDESDDDLFEVKETVEEESVPEPEESISAPDILDDDLFKINDTIEEESLPEPEVSITTPDETFDLLSEPTENIDLDTDIKDESEIIVDITKTSQIMGISDEDYTLFLNEYIDTALALEEELQSDNANTRNGAIGVLTDLSEIMHLPEISNIMANINASSPEQQKGYLGYLYTTLSRLTTQSSSNKAVEEELFDSIDISSEPEAMSVTEPEPQLETESATGLELDLDLDLETEAKVEVEEPESEPEVETQKEVNPNSFGTIDLSDVKSKHFDFQLEEAANDLSLPVELIEEFVHDFIEQAHIETKKMLEAYEEGDLAKIQAIGHLLKGASSNLRINALSDTLYKIQFCENEHGLDNLIKDYWAHFLSFEHQINVISN